jgi:DNA polymerase-3 subunit epsilon
MNLVELSEIARAFVALIPITRPILFFDTETTGPNPTQDRIVELGFVQIKPDGECKEWRTLMRPGIPIPHEASHGNGDTYEGHGITDAMVNACRVCGGVKEDENAVFCTCETFAPWPTFGDLASNLHKGFSGSDFGGYNIKHFDLPLVQEEFKRHGFPLWSYDDACIVDSFRIWQILKPRTLTDAMREFLDESHAGAHSAVDDVRASLRIAIKQIEASQLPRDLRGLHDAQFPRDPNAVDPEGRFVWKDGIVVVNFGKKWKGVRLDMMTRRDLDWIANKAEVMSPTARQIARDAMAGKFPTKENV